jgi:hypothetical protein
MKLTRQGVRALGWARRRRPLQVPPDCDHALMRWCCRRPCGHLICAGCGLFWDLAADLP